MSDQIKPETLLSLTLSAQYGDRCALDNVSLSIARGEILGLVGESGCGKSTLALSVLRLLSLKGGKAKGTLCFNGRDLMLLKEREMRQVRGKEIGLVLQSPMSSLNPALKIGTQLAEAWKVHRKGSKDECRQALLQALSHASLPAAEHFLLRYPAQLSVGQAQRVLIAMAVLHRPALLIADEPTSALDVITQAEILKLFSKLSRDLGIAILYISHDLLSVATIAHRIAVMNQGEIVECAKSQDIFLEPQHPYTRTLISSLPLDALRVLGEQKPGLKAQAATK